MTDSAADAWANFVASINPVALERERMRVHGDLMAERFGSREHHEMEFAHDYVRRDFWERMNGEIGLRAKRRQVDNADAEIRARGFDRIASTDEDNEIEAAIRSYSQRQAAAAAERNAA